MKKLLLFAFLFFFVCLAEAQKRKIPVPVTDAFAVRYPHATQVQWSDKLQYFEASFLLNGVSVSANFSSMGEWENSERTLNFDELPGEVRDGFQKSRYSGWQKNCIAEVQELGKPLQYRMTIRKPGSQKKNLYFDTNGKLVKESSALQ